MKQPKSRTPRGPLPAVLTLKHPEHKQAGRWWGNRRCRCPASGWVPAHPPPPCFPPSMASVQEGMKGKDRSGSLPILAKPQPQTRELLHIPMLVNSIQRQFSGLAFLNVEAEREAGIKRGKEGKREGQLCGKREKKEKGAKHLPV